MIGNRFKKNNKHGFTLIELVVVLGLFSLIVLVIVNVYLLSIRAQRQSSFRLDVVSDLRYITESISRQVRVSEINFSDSIDYNSDGEADITGVYSRDNDVGINGAEIELSLIDQDGNTYYYYRDDNELMLNLSGQTAPLNDEDEIIVTSLAFYISPKTDPFFDERCSVKDDCRLASSGCSISGATDGSKVGFCGCSEDIECATLNCSAGVCLPFNNHPAVTIVIGLRSVSVKDEEKKEIILQTTVSSRVYKR